MHGMPLELPARKNQTWRSFYDYVSARTDSDRIQFNAVMGVVSDEERVAEECSRGKIEDAFCKTCASRYWL